MTGSVNEFEGFSLERAVAAETLAVLSSRSGKLVEHVEDQEGSFVRRTYLPEGVTEVTSGDIDFADAWDVFGEMFASAGIEVVPCTLIDESLDTNPIIVTKYLGKLRGAEATKAVPKETKVELVGKLGSLLTVHDDFLPDPQAFMTDGFAVDQDNGRLVLVDVDPYVKVRGRSRISRLDAIKDGAVQGAFMRRSGWNIAEWAVDEDERSAMATAFCRTAGEAITDDSSMELINHFSYVHFMANGMSPDQLASMGY